MGSGTVSGRGRVIAGAVLVPLQRTAMRAGTSVVGRPTAPSLAAAAAAPSGGARLAAGTMRTPTGQYESLMSCRGAAPGARPPACASARVSATTAHSRSGLRARSEPSESCAKSCPAALKPSHWSSACGRMGTCNRHRRRSYFFCACLRGDSSPPSRSRALCRGAGAGASKQTLPRLRAQSPVRPPCEGRAGSAWSGRVGREDRGVDSRGAGRPPAPLSAACCPRAGRGGRPQRRRRHAPPSSRLRPEAARRRPAQRSAACAPGLRRRRRQLPAPHLQPACTEEAHELAIRRNGHPAVAHGRCQRALGRV